MVGYHTPETLAEVFALKAQHGSASILLGGGTIVMNMLNEAARLPEVVIGLRRAGLDTVETVGDQLHIGAMTTISTLADRSPPMLADAAAACGAWAIRNMATVGGNVFAPAPAGDLGVALLALNADVHIARSSGERVVSISDFYAGGRDLAPDEVVTGFAVADTSLTTRFVKFGRKSGATPSVVTVAIALDLTGGVVSDPRIALGAMAPHPVRATEAEVMLDGQPLSAPLIAAAADAAVSGLDGLTDALATAWYRRRMAQLHVSRLLTNLLEDRAR